MTGFARFSSAPFIDRVAGVGMPALFIVVASAFLRAAIDAPSSVRFTSPSSFAWANHAPSLLFFLHMVLNHFREDLNLGVVELIIGFTGHDLCNEDLGPVMLDVRFIVQLLLHRRLDRRVEKLFLDGRMDG